VNNEHAKNLQNDFRRFYNLMKETSNTKHPFAKFGTGDITTLKDVPLEKGIDVRKALVEFHAKYYSSNIMKLAVIGKESLDELQAMVLENFSAVQNKGLQRPTFAKDAFSVGMEAVYDVKPLKEMRKLELYWDVPLTTPDLDSSKPHHLLTHLLGDEGEGSVFSYLRKQGWATGLGTSIAYAGSTCCNLFKVGVELTQEGMGHQQEITDAVYAYIHLLAASPDAEIARIAAEQGQVLANSFRFKNKESPVGYISDLAARMQDMKDPVDVLRKYYYVDDFSVGLFRTFLARLTPANMRVHVISQDWPEDQHTRSEQWYGTKYKQQPTAERFDVAAWALEACGANPVLSQALHLPPPNPFIPSDFSILSGAAVPDLDGLKTPPTRLFAAELFADADTDAKQELTAQQTARHEQWEVWCKTDTAFLLPKVNVDLQLETALVDDSAAHLAVSKLMVNLIRDEMTEVCECVRVSVYVSIPLSTSGICACLHVCLSVLSHSPPPSSSTPPYALASG
jgi:insulysin